MDENRLGVFVRRAAYNKRPRATNEEGTRCVNAFKVTR